MTDASPAVTATIPAERASVWEDFIDIFYAPAQVFARRAAAGSVWIPLLVVTVAMSALIYVNTGLLESMFSAEFDRGMAVAMKSNREADVPRRAPHRRLCVHAESLGSRRARASGRVSGSGDA